VGGQLRNPVALLLLRSAVGRRILFRNFLCHGEWLSAARAHKLYFEDAMACTIMDDAAGWGEMAEPLNPLPCAITLAWSEFDRLVPVEPYGRMARELLPGATWTVLLGVGHNPLFDDPALVARTILAVTGA